MDREAKGGPSLTRGHVAGLAEGCSAFLAESGFFPGTPPTLHFPEEPWLPGWAEDAVARPLRAMGMTAPQAPVKPPLATPPSSSAETSWGARGHLRRALTTGGAAPLHALHCSREALRPGLCWAAVTGSWASLGGGSHRGRRGSTRTP